MTTNGLEKRVSALEAVVEDERLRPLRVLAQERGLDVGRVREIYGECRARTARLRAEGKSEREIVEATAVRRGIEPDTLLRRVQEIAERFGLGPASSCRRRRGAPSIKSTCFGTATAGPR
jgi:hypothetical protein